MVAHSTQHSDTTHTWMHRLAPIIAATSLYSTVYLCHGHMKVSSKCQNLFLDSYVYFYQALFRCIENTMDITIKRTLYCSE